MVMDSNSVQWPRLLNSFLCFQTLRLKVKFCVHEIFSAAKLTTFKAKSIIILPLPPSSSCCRKLQTGSESVLCCR